MCLKKKERKEENFTYIHTFLYEIHAYNTQEKIWRGTQQTEETEKITRTGN
jgi:hypothetical protein